MHHNGHSNNHLLWMLLGCGLLILVLAYFGDRISSGWLFALIIGACVIPHLFMMRKQHHDEKPHHEDPQPPTAGDDKTPPHKGGSCCH